MASIRTRWERAAVVAQRLDVADRTVRKWAESGFVESRREGPRLIYVKVYDDGELEGRPVGLETTNEGE